MSTLFKVFLATLLFVLLAGGAAQLGWGAVGWAFGICATLCAVTCLWMTIDGM